MATSDPIADMLTRIRNGVRARRKNVNVKRSKVCTGLAQVLKAEGYIQDYTTIEDNNQGELRIALKYSEYGEPSFHELKRSSKPGCRSYQGYRDLPRVLDGMGISIVSTSRGVMSDRQCREEKVGGEVLCTVW